MWIKPEEILLTALWYDFLQFTNGIIFLKLLFFFLTGQLNVQIHFLNCKDVVVKMKKKVVLQVY